MKFQRRKKAVPQVKLQKPRRAAKRAKRGTTMINGSVVAWEGEPPKPVDLASNPQYFCETCEVQCATGQGFSSHNRGEAHRQNVHDAEVAAQAGFFNNSKDEVPPQPITDPIEAGLLTALGMSQDATEQLTHQLHALKDERSALSIEIEKGEHALEELGSKIQVLNRALDDLRGVKKQYAGVHNNQQE